MAHSLGELTLLVPPPRDACTAAELASLRAELAKRGVVARCVDLGRDPDGTVRRLVTGGARWLALCGSDRALHQIAAAVVEGGPDVVLGVFAGSTRNDFARGFGLYTNPRTAAAILAREGELPIDVGVAHFTGGGAERRSYVLNDVVIGLGAVALRREARLRPFGRVGGLLAWWSACAAFRRTHVDVDMVFAEWHDTAVQVRLSNGQFAHDGLHIAPIALPDDGVWDVQVWDGPRSLPFTLQPKMALGEHLPHKHISQWRQKQASVTSARPLPVAVDGTAAGTTPVSFELRHRALRLKL
ncbi:MAG TPA: diacylglycerol kinase family protein [Mycobacteriales bacterium]|jgi:diacylglycerol kinase family enzyme|nr:diacylglycerol kinase family protein [Mycobacteriales bacterium]